MAVLGGGLVGAIISLAAMVGKSALVSLLQTLTAGDTDGVSPTGVFLVGGLADSSSTSRGASPAPGLQATNPKSAPSSATRCNFMIADRSTPASPTAAPPVIPPRTNRSQISHLTDGANNSFARRTRAAELARQPCSNWSSTLTPRSARPAEQVPGLVDTDAETVFLDIDDTIRAVFWVTKQGAEREYTKVRGLNAQLATGSSAPGVHRIPFASGRGALRARGGADDP